MHLFRSINPESVDSKDEYIVYNHLTDTVVESQPTLVRAVKAMDILNDHRIRHDKPYAYGLAKASEVEYIYHEDQEVSHDPK